MRKVINACLSGIFLLLPFHGVTADELEIVKLRPFNFMNLTAATRLLTDEQNVCFKSDLAAQNFYLLAKPVATSKFYLISNGRQQIKLPVNLYWNDVKIEIAQKQIIDVKHEGDLYCGQLKAEVNLDKKSLAGAYSLAVDFSILT